MNDVSQNKKDSILKSLAIAGFISIIILIAWLSVQLVNIIPGAFSSLASLAEGVGQRQQSALEEGEQSKLTVTSNATLINVGEQVEVSWEQSSKPGTYTFYYDCTEGVAVNLIETEGVRRINCDTNYNIGSVNSLTLSIESEKERYANVDYTVSFLGTNDMTPRSSGEASLTVINTDIRNILAVEEVTEEKTEETVEESVTPAEPVNPNPITSTPTYEQEFTYSLPVSDPNGRTDLSVRFLNTGKIIGNSFTAGVIYQSDSGAIQFEVKNLGTKTSGEWSYTVSLPNGGTYDSSEQPALKPNERAVVTIGFPTSDESKHDFVVTVDGPTDRNSINDRFVQPVTIIQ
jgi:hypothetical protein